MRHYLTEAAVLAAIVLGVAACAHGAVTAPAAPLPTVCPALRDYSRAEELQLAQAVQALPAGNALVGAMADYGALRAQVRACHVTR